MAAATVVSGSSGSPGPRHKRRLFWGWRASAKPARCHDVDPGWRHCNSSPKGDPTTSHGIREHRGPGHRRAVHGPGRSVRVPHLARSGALAGSSRPTSGFGTGPAISSWSGARSPRSPRRVGAARRSARAAADPGTVGCHAGPLFHPRRGFETIFALEEEGIPGDPGPPHPHGRPGRLGDARPPRGRGQTWCVRSSRRIATPRGPNWPWRKAWPSGLLVNYRLWTRTRPTSGGRHAG